MAKKNRGLRWTVMWLILLLSGYYFLQSDFFNIRSVLVEGNERLAADELVGLAAITSGENIWRLDEIAVAERLKGHPLVRTAQVRRKFPGTVVLKVQERQAVALIGADDRFIILDSWGVSLGTMEDIGGVPLPVITGVKLSWFPAKGEAAQGEQLDLALKVAVALADSWKKKDQVLEIDVSQAPKVNVYTPGGVEIRLGGSDRLLEKLDLAEKIIASAEQPLEYIDVTARPVVKLLEKR